ncbi:MAG: hypothetical protein ING21_03535 [Burkholderiales bacterium]|jgi:hypothetical protein|nr:hypothetical protein [Burkholderiales bacterium]MCA3162195.1 hypothetical protein [Burkholderiales bacterium]MCA3164052.1 hypothetical protein [Burkholderiales bacterium]MCA3165557.1 hypothetical protein [Burkholderiales bacterium]MCA3171170.1 hypothetical protein [Burkholderiales bacterium]
MDKPVPRGCTPNARNWNEPFTGASLSFMPTLMNSVGEKSCDTYLAGAFSGKIAEERRVNVALKELRCLREKKIV